VKKGFENNILEKEHQLKEFKQQANHQYQQQCKDFESNLKKNGGLGK